METLNLDLVQPWNMMNRMLAELYKSQSANLSFVIDPDKARIKQYLSAMRTLTDYISDKPDLDLPETNPMSFPLNAMTADQQIENEAISHLCKLIKVAMLELQASSSSRASSGLISFDRQRHLNILTKIEKHVEDYINKEMPIDLPESSPKAPVQGHGANTLGGNA